MSYLPRMSVLATPRGPGWDKPRSPHADNEEMKDDPFVAGRLICLINGSVGTRTGGIDPWTAPAAGTYRSEVNNGICQLQVPVGAGVWCYKAVTSPTNQEEIYWCGISRNADSVARLMMNKTTGSAPDNNNRVYCGFWSSVQIGMAIVTGGSSSGFTSGGPVAPDQVGSMAPSIIFARRDALSTANWAAGIISRDGSIVRIGSHAAAGASPVSFMGFDLVAGGGGVGGIYNLHFLRRAVGAAAWVL